MREHALLDLGFSAPSTDVRERAHSIIGLLNEGGVVRDVREYAPHKELLQCDVSRCVCSQQMLMSAASLICMICGGRSKWLNE